MTFPLIETSLSFEVEMRRIADAAVWDNGFAAGLAWAQAVIGGRSAPQTQNPYATTHPYPAPSRCPACDDPECELNQPLKG